MGKIRDLTKQKFGFLEVLEYAGLDQHQKALWRCSCKCGGETVATSASLVRGKKRSCGCMANNGTGVGADGIPVLLLECRQCGEKFPNTTRAHNRRICDKCRLENRLSYAHSAMEPAKIDAKPYYNAEYEARKKERERLNHPDVSKCKKCIYRAFITSGSMTGSVYGCQYILITGKKRPCKPGKNCTVYEKRGRK